LGVLENLPQQKLVLVFPMTLLLYSERQWNLQELKSPQLRKSGGKLKRKMGKRRLLQTRLLLKQS